MQRFHHQIRQDLAALLGALWAPWGWLVRRLLGGVPSRGRVATALVVVPSGWLTIELVRSWQGLGGPWGVLGASQWQVEAALRLASVGGTWLLSFLVVVLNVAVAVLVAVRRARVPALAGLVATAAAASAAWVFSPRPGTDDRVRIGPCSTGRRSGEPAATGAPEVAASSWHAAQERSRRPCAVGARECGHAAGKIYLPM